MFHPLSLYIGLRYARARSHRFFVSFITWVSLLGVAVGVAALIVILSVMNGFESELRGRLLSLSSPIRVDQAEDPRQRERQVGTLKSVPGVTAVSPYVELQALAVRQPEMLPLQLRGLEDSALQSLRPLLLDASEAGVVPKQDELLLGDLVARQLGVATGDRVTLMVPDLGDGERPQARLREFTVAGRFEAGVQEHDATLAFATLRTLESLGASGAGQAGLNLSIDTPLAAPQVAAAAREALRRAGLDASAVRDWTQDHASYFRAIRIEKTMMALILMLIVAVAAFNIVAMLVMVVTDKRSDIAILRTQGAGPASVAGVFVTQGLLVGGLGVALGAALGMLLARNVTPVLAFLDRYAGIRIFDADVFYITTVPSELHGRDVWLICIAALLLTALATLYPARRAARVSPAEALRYE